MQIDRKSFLAWTAALATGACNAPPAATPTVDVPTTPATVDASAAQPGPTDAGTAPTPSIAPIATTPQPVADDTTCTPASAPGPAAPDCNLKKPPTMPSCESFKDTVSECKEWKKWLKPAVAEKAARCLRHKSGTVDLCDFTVTTQCTSEAFRSTCGDPATRSDCEAVAKKCASARHRGGEKVTVAECQGALAGVADKHRGAMLSCMNEGCGAGACLSSLP